MLLRFTALWFLLCALVVGCDTQDHGQVYRDIAVSGDREERNPNNQRVTASTQSMVRGFSRLEELSSVDVEVKSGDLLDLNFKNIDGKAIVGLRDLPLADFLPSLNYPAASPPDDFDLYNLWLAEFSRNGIAFPAAPATENEMESRATGAPRFVALMKDSAPWLLRGDYQFTPNPNVRPLRVQLTNNCLYAGLWEIAAADKSGELYHGWFELPLGLYRREVAAKNAMSPAIVGRALKGENEPTDNNTRAFSPPTPLALSRLRQLRGDTYKATVSTEDGPLGYSSSESRRKRERGYVYLRASPSSPSDKESVAATQLPDGRFLPRMLSHLHESRVFMADFVSPGIYQTAKPRSFDFGFLSKPQSASVSLSQPLTQYCRYFGDPTSCAEDWQETVYLEIEITLASGESIVLGNLPMALLGEREDFPIFGFGVGIPPPSDLGERRDLLYQRAPAPSFAYLARRADKTGSAASDLIGLNSHERGIEQVYLRARPFGEKPHWQVTLASFERITDLVRYRIEIPAALLPRQKLAASRYTSPAWLNYRDDWLR